MLGLNKEDTDAKNWAARNSGFELMNPSTIVKKKQFRLLNRSTLMSELGPKCRRAGNRREKSDFKEFIF